MPLRERSLYQHFQSILIYSFTKALIVSSGFSPFVVLSGIHIQRQNGSSNIPHSVDTSQLRRQNSSWSFLPSWETTSLDSQAITLVDTQLLMLTKMYLPFHILFSSYKKKASIEHTLISRSKNGKIGFENKEHKFASLPALMRSYSHILKQPPSSIKLYSLKYFHGLLLKEEADYCLRNREDGSYLLR